MRIIQAAEFDTYWNNRIRQGDGCAVTQAVQDIITGVREEGDAALRRYAERFERSKPEQFEVPSSVIKQAQTELAKEDAALWEALTVAAAHIRQFAQLQRCAFSDFEVELETGVFTGQRVIPVRRAGVYIPAGGFPLISTVLMTAIPALVAGVETVCLASPPREDGLPDRRILAAAGLVGVHRVFAIGGAQAIAAFAWGTESVPKVDVVVGPGNKYVAEAKRILFGEVGIDFIAGPTDVLIIADDPQPAFGRDAAELIAADMLAQAEHDADARARVLVPSEDFAQKIVSAVNAQLKALDTRETAQASLDAGGLIIVYSDEDAAVRIANTIAPEHLELQLVNPDAWIHKLINYGSLFVGKRAAEVIGDYSAGINHTLPTSGSARFTGGLSVRNFLKVLTTLRCEAGSGFERTRRAAETIAHAEGLAGHEASAKSRKA
ncbi:histidinol dehydrogenase [Breznakiellaceae bacterium SP9]